MDYTGKIISLAFPDTFVKHSEEHTTKILLSLGLGKHDYIKAGHSAMVLIQNETGKAEYYDFGRYITPLGKGRVRSAVTDVELEIPFDAVITKDRKLANLDDFLLWLEANPQKTHGSGRLVASVCDYIYYDQARDFVLSIQELGSIPYKAFGKRGSSNCSRIVADTILAGTDSLKIRKPLIRNKLFTPSPLGNVGKSALDNPIYQVEKGDIYKYPGSVLRENLTNYFDKNIPKPSEKKAIVPPEYLKDAHFLHGIGSSAYFKMTEVSSEGFFEIKRYTEYGEEDFRGFFKTKDVFDISQEYHFVYDSHCKYCHVEQQGRRVKFELAKRIEN